MNLFSRFLFFSLLLAGLSSWAQQGETRVALVIGNGAYKVSPLRNPVNDAKDMATKLRSLGFNVVERNNLTVKQIGSTLREFRGKLVPGSVALFFYAGHGVQIKGENYLPAIDAEIAGEDDIPNQSLAIRQVMDILGDAKTRLNLVFLDACRNNPYARSFRSAGDGLTRVVAPSGTLISFATRPGSVASDGDGKNGLYTGALLAAMNNVNQPIEQVLKRVVSIVKNLSNSQQEPWTEGSIEGEFCFAACGEVLQGGELESIRKEKERLEKSTQMLQEERNKLQQQVELLDRTKKQEAELQARILQLEAESKRVENDQAAENEKQIEILRLEKNKQEEGKLQQERELLQLKVRRDELEKKAAEAEAISRQVLQLEREKAEGQRLLKLEREQKRTTETVPRPAVSVPPIM